jgi:HK97 family phage prohead protease
MTEESVRTRSCERTFALEDLHIRSEGGDGREVEAYAAVWKDQSGKQIRTEIRDQDGHYHEELSSSAFNRTIQHRGTGFGVLFNHGLTVDGSPNPMGTMPIGVPIEVRADERGVYTRTRYLNNPLADHVLDAIKQGAIRAQSFSGAFRKSTRSYPDGQGKGRPAGHHPSRGGDARVRAGRVRRLPGCRDPRLSRRVVHALTSRHPAR